MAYFRSYAGMLDPTFKQLIGKTHGKPVIDWLPECIHPNTKVTGTRPIMNTNWKQETNYYHWMGETGHRTMTGDVVADRRGQSNGFDQNPSINRIVKVELKKIKQNERNKTKRNEMK